MHERDAVCCRELLCFQSLMSRKENERQGKLRDGEGCVRRNGTEHTPCSEWRTEASAKSLRLLTASRMLVGLLHLPSRTSKAFTGLVLSSPGGVKTSVYRLRYPPALGESPACTQGVRDLPEPEPANQVLHSNGPGGPLPNQKTCPLPLRLAPSAARVTPALRSAPTALASPGPRPTEPGRAFPRPH